MHPRRGRDGAAVPAAGRPRPRELSVTGLGRAGDGPVHAPRAEAAQVLGGGAAGRGQGPAATRERKNDESTKIIFYSTERRLEKRLIDCSRLRLLLKKILVRKKNNFFPLFEKKLF